MSVKYARVLKDCPRLRCNFLSTTVRIAGYILSFRSTVDFEGLRCLRILRTWMPNFGPRNDYSADYVIRTAVGLCPNQTHLSVCVNFVSAKNLDEVEGFGRFKTLEIECPALGNLSFLRHCSDALEELQLAGCLDLPSGEFAELWRLRKLRTTFCRFLEGDLAASVAALRNLESLQLASCSVVRDLSVLRHCGRLRELRVTNSPLPDSRVTETLGGPLHDLQLTTTTDSQWVGVVLVAVTADGLSAALSGLEERGLANSCLDYLRAVRHCPQLGHLCCEFMRGYSDLEMTNVRVRITLTGSTYS